MNAKTQNTSELNKQCADKNTLSGIVIRLFNVFDLKSIIKSIGFEKPNSRSVCSLLQNLILFRLYGESIFRSLVSGKGPDSFGKDCYYRLYKDSQIDWRKLLYATSLFFRHAVAEKGDGQTKGPRCLIFDDTLIQKSNSGCEGCTKVHDHVSHKAVYGMKVLTAAYFDGLTTTVTDFSIHRELGKNGKGGLSNAEWEYQYSKKRPAQSPGTKRFNEIDKSKMAQVPEMIRRGVCHGLKIEYALFDSWFTCPKLISEIRSIGKQNIHVVALHKMDNQRFSVNGKLYHIQDLVALNERNARPCRNMKAVFFALRGEMGGIPVKIFFVRYGRQDKWRLLITTDLSLSFVKAFEIYQIRWTTEVLYKECRQYLRFGEYQGTDFDGMIADVTLTFLTHTMLTLDKRFQSYETFGEIFRETQIRLLESSLWERILPMIYRLIELLADITGLSVNEIMDMILQDEEKAEIYAELCNLIERQRSA